MTCTTHIGFAEITASEMSYNRNHTLICTGLKNPLAFCCPFNRNSDLIVILHTYSAHSRPTPGQLTLYIHILCRPSLFFKSRSWSWIRDWSFRGSRAAAATPWTRKSFNSSSPKEKERVILLVEGVGRSHGILTSLLMKKIWLSDSTSFLVTGGRWLLGASHGEQLRKLRSTGKWEVRKPIRVAIKSCGNSCFYSFVSPRHSERARG